MARMTGSDCAVMWNLINTHTHTHIHTHTHTVSLIPPWEDECGWHRMTRMTGPDCAFMRNLINTHHTHTNKQTQTERERARERGSTPVDEHKMGTRTETRGGTVTETGARTGTGMRLTTRLWRVEEKGRIAKNCTSVVDFGGKRKQCRQEMVGSVAADPDNLENIKEAGGGGGGRALRA